MEERIVTIKDVAEKAGVSIGTVSNVINGLSSVKKENKDRVLKAMKELDYIPNITARNLKTNKSRTIGLILPTIVNPFFPAVAKGVEDLANRMGYTTVLCNSDREPEKEKHYLEMLISNRAAGAILVKSRLSQEQIYQYSKKIKLVLVDSSIDFNKNIDIIEISNYEGSFRAVDYLIYDLGHRKIAYITGDLSSKSDMERFIAYKDALISRDISIDESYIKKGDFSLESGFKYGLELLQMQGRPTAICCGNDLMAIGVIKAARELGIDVPGRLSVVGFDDIDMCEIVTPTLTTVKHPKYEQGEKAARVLLNKIKNDSNHVVKNYVLYTELKVRESTAMCYENHE